MDSPERRASDKPRPATKRKVSTLAAEGSSDILTSIMANMTENDLIKNKGREARIAAENRDITETAIQQILATLHGVSGTAAAHPQKSVEVENQNAFRAGVAHDDWNAMRNYFEAAPELECLVIKETDYIYEKQDLVQFFNFDAESLADVGESVRLTFDNNTSKWHASAKRRLTSTTAPMPAGACYDVRVSVALEQQLALPATELATLPPPNYRTRRDKQRRSYRRREGGLWVTDLTFVTSLRNEHYRGRTAALDEVEAETYEVEFEFVKEIIARLSNESQLLSVIRQMWDALGKVNRMQPPQRDEAQGSDLTAMNAIKVKSRDELDHLRHSVLKLIPSAEAEHGNAEFPGSMPVALSRRHFGRLLHAPYHVSEKTDGVRYFLYVSSKQAVYLIDRKFDFYSITESFSSLCNVLAEEGTTLLDGEMIRHLESSKFYFMVFDVIYSNGHSVALSPLRERLPQIAEVIRLYRNGVESQLIPPEHPFSLIGKGFYPKEQIRELLKHIKSTPTERIYKDNRRCHYTDGLIFTPSDEPYSARGTPTLYKWKYIDRISIDFKLVTQRDQLQLACRGNSNELIVCRNADFLPEDMRKVRRMHSFFSHPQKVSSLLRDLELQRRRKGSTEAAPPIVECAYDPGAGTWRLHMVRSDKAQPNHIRVVFDTMESIAENISRDELVAMLDKTGKHSAALSSNHHAKHETSQGGKATT